MTPDVEMVKADKKFIMIVVDGNEWHKSSVTNPVLLILRYDKISLIRQMLTVYISILFNAFIKTVNGSMLQSAERQLGTH